MVKSLPASAGGTGVVPGPGRPHVPRRVQASEPQRWSRAPERPGATASEDHALQSSGSAPRDAAATRDPPPTAREQPPPAATREKPALQRRPSTAKVHGLIQLKNNRTGQGAAAPFVWGSPGHPRCCGPSCLDASPMEYQYCHAVRNQ